nr:CMRF35-like molecule 8 [Aotus nancymaae]
MAACRSTWTLTSRMENQDHWEWNLGPVQKCPLVVLSPASTSVTPTSVTAARTSAITTAFPPVPSTTLLTVSATHSTSIQGDNEEVVNLQLPLLLSLLALLLLLLVGASLLVWRMFQKRVKGELAPHTPLPPPGVVRP